MLVCKKCGGWFVEDNDGSYYEDDNLIEKYVGSCTRCGQSYTWECVKPIVESTVRNFQEL